ncbi:MAG TPA: hypothetical protein VKZ18_15800 [Polyangia bacterium]|nr:hypothetical protein [Polyangia bacterium]
MRQDVRIPHRRAAGGLGVLLAALLALPADAPAAVRKGPTCGFSGGAGATITTTLALPHSPLGRNVAVAVSKSGAPGGTLTTTTRVFRGRRSFLVFTATVAPSGALDATAQFGAGFHGIRTVTLASTDGQTFHGTVDGRALLPFGADASPDTVRFAGGGAIPRVRIKRALQAVLRKLARVSFQACTGVGGAPGSAVRPADVFGDLCKSLGPDFLRKLGLSECDCCQDACSVSAVSAEAGGILGCAASLIGCVIGEVGVLKGQVDCYDACQHGSACCPVPCAEGHPDQDCAGTCSDGAVCCGGAGNPSGQCCDSAADCCGGASSALPTCLEGIFAGYVCANPETGAFCYPGQGDVCADTSMPGLGDGGGVLGSGSACCPADAPVCRDLANHVCCAAGAGDVCGSACCPAGTPPLRRRVVLPRDGHLRPRRPVLSRSARVPREPMLQSPESRLHQRAERGVELLRGVRPLQQSERRLLSRADGHRLRTLVLRRGDRSLRRNGTHGAVLPGGAGVRERLLPRGGVL